MIKKVIKPDPFNRFYYIDLVYKIMRGGLNAPRDILLWRCPKEYSKKPSGLDAHEAIITV